jgi:predicted nucleotidyltransferase
MRLTDLATELGSSSRTLRRYVAGGAVRATRPSPRRIEMSSDEYSYLKAQWGLLASLTEALRTERNVRLAVFYGPLAEGTGTTRSPVHLAVDLKRTTTHAEHALVARIEERTGRRVEVVRAAVLNDEQLANARVLINRD